MTESTPGSREIDFEGRRLRFRQYETEEAIGSYLQRLEREWPERNAVAEHIAQRIATLPVATPVVLELCCGPGRLAQVLFKRLPTMRYTGVDLSPPFLAYAQRDLAPHAARLILHEVDLRDPKWPQAVTSALATTDVSATVGPATEGVATEGVATEGVATEGVATEGVDTGGVATGAPSNEYSGDGHKGAQFHAIVSLQSLHDVGDEEALAALYAQALTLLQPGGFLLNADLVVAVGQELARNPGRRSIPRHLELLANVGYINPRCTLARGDFGCVVGWKAFS